MTAQLSHGHAASAADLIEISRYDEISEILRSRSFVQGAYPDSRHSIARGVTTVLDGKVHLRRRNILAGLFSDQAVAELRRTYLVPVLDQCLAELDAAPRQADGTTRADLVPLSQRFVHRLAAAVGGIDGLASEAVVDRFVRQLRDLVGGIAVEWSREDPASVMRRALEAQEAFRRDFFDPSSARRRSLVEAAGADEQAAGRLPRDVLTQIILHRDDAWQGDEDLPLRELQTFLVAASQTTANSFISFILRLEAWFREHPDDRTAMASEPDFLRNAALESLRMTVAAPARIRTAVESVRLGSGREIASGQRVALLFIPANAEPDRFGPDAAVFNPRRPLNDSLPWGLAFGMGVHSCPGRPLVTGSRSLKAKTEVDGTMVSMARRLYAAGLQLDPRHPPVPDRTTQYDLYTSVPILLSGPFASRGAGACPAG